MAFKEFFFQNNTMYVHEIGYTTQIQHYLLRQDGRYDDIGRRQHENDKIITVFKICGCYSNKINR